MAKLTLLFFLLLVSGGCVSQSILFLDCYKCGIDSEDDYCPSRSSRWTEQRCQTTAKLTDDETLACSKTVWTVETREGVY